MEEKRSIELDVSGEHDIFVLFNALERMRDEFIDRSQYPIRVVGAPYLEWAAAAEKLRLQVQGI